MLVRSVVVLAIVLMVMTPCASAAVKAQQLEMKAGTATVTVKEHTGRVLEKAEVALKGASGKTVATFATDKKGQFTVKDLAPGAYRLVVANRAQVPFSVTDKANVTSLVVVLPAPPKYAAGQPKRAFAMPTLLVFIIGAAAVAGGIILLSNSGGSHGHP